MNSNLFGKRLLAAIIDNVFIMVISFTLCTYVLTNQFADFFDQQMAPFVLIQLLLLPFSLLMQIIAYPNAYGNVCVIYILFAISFFIELVYYSFFELIPLRRTPGYMLLGIYIDYENKKFILPRIIIRNILKIISARHRA